MSKTDFSPGPWESLRVSYGGQKGLYVKQSGDKGLFLVRHTFDGIQAEANTKLIAAAPDMYEALSEILTLIANVPLDKNVLTIITLCERAMVKANGEEPSNKYDSFYL